MDPNIVLFGVAGGLAAVAFAVALIFLVLRVPTGNDRMREIAAAIHVELWGPHIPVGDVAASAGTIAYELLCNAKRAPRVTESRFREDSGIERRHGGKS